MDNEQECGGAYVKLLSDESLDQRAFSKSTPYLLMFGPDVCGGLDELKIVVRKNGSEYYHWKKDTSHPIDIYPHLYTLIWRQNGTY